MTDQKTETLQIKYMVCPRCIEVVRTTLDDLGLQVDEVELGEAVIESSRKVSEADINDALKKNGFELIRSRDQQQADAIKAALRDYLQQIEEKEEPPKLSEYLADALHQNYASLSTAFSEAEEITIEKFMIRLKIERVKSLLQAGDLSLGDIAWKLNYSSTAHLSSQFKQVTGMSPTQYQKSL